MNATEMNHTLDYMEELDYPAYVRIVYAGHWACLYWMRRNWAVEEVFAATLIAEELQCIVEAMRYERMGGVFIAGGGGK